MSGDYKIRQEKPPKRGFNYMDENGNQTRFSMSPWYHFLFIRRKFRWPWGKNG